MKITSLYVDDTSIRIMMTRGEQIKDWAYLPLDRGLVVSNVVADKAAFASRIKLVLKTLDIDGKTVNVGLSGLHCLNRVITLPQLPGDMLDKAVVREAKRVLPVALEQLYLSWHSERNSNGQLKVFMMAVPRTTVDSLIEALHLAGLRVNFLGIKPLLLAKMLQLPAAILVDAQPTDFDIVIVVDGAPQTIRTIPFPEEGATFENKLETIRNELDRTISFYNTNNPDALTEDAPVVVSGKLTDEVDLCKVFSELTKRLVMPLEPSANIPPGFDKAPYLPNIGLTLCLAKHIPKSSRSLVTLNALPAAYQTRQISLGNILFLPAGVAAAGLIVFLVLANQSVGAEVNSMSVKASAVEQSFQESVINRKDLLDDVQDLEKRLNQVKVAHDNYLSALDAIEDRRLQTNKDLLAVVKDMPKAIKLGSIKHTGVTLEVSGLAQSENDVLTYLTQLQSSNVSGEIAVTNMVKLLDKGVSFTMQVNGEKPGGEISGSKVALKYLPSDVNLTSFSQSKDTITINGRSPNEDSIILFLRQLEESQLFREISLSGKTANVDGGLDFIVFVRM